MIRRKPPPVNELDRYLRELGLAPATRASYHAIVLRMDEDDPVGWLRAQIAKRRPVGTILPMRAAVKHVLIASGMDPDEAAKVLPKARGRKARTRDALSPDALAAYYDVADTEGEPVRTILLLLPRTGLRIAEMCSLRTTDVLVSGSKIHIQVTAGKGDKARTIPLGKEGAAVLRAYVNGDHAGSRWLFQGYSGSPLTPAAVRHVTRRIADESPELGALSPHVLRHTYATRALGAGTDLRRVQALLGHESMATTARYLHPTTHDLERAVDVMEGM